MRRNSLDGDVALGLRFGMVVPLVKECQNDDFAGVWENRPPTSHLAEGRQEGKVEGEQELLLRQGTKRFGEPDAATIAALEAIQDIDRLGALGERILDPNIQDWNDLLRTA